MAKRIGVMLSVAILLIGGWLIVPSFGEVTVTLDASTATSSPTGLSVNDEYAVVGVDCPSGEVVVGGGVMQVQSNGEDLTSFATAAIVLHGSRPKASGTGWEVLVRNTGLVTHYVKVYARCV